MGQALVVEGDKLAYRRISLDRHMSRSDSASFIIIGVAEPEREDQFDGRCQYRHQHLQASVARSWRVIVAMRRPRSDLSGGDRCNASARSHCNARLWQKHDGHSGRGCAVLQVPAR